MPINKKKQLEDIAIKLRDGRKRGYIQIDKKIIAKILENRKLTWGSPSGSLFMCKKCGLVHIINHGMKFRERVSNLKCKCGGTDFEDITFGGSISSTRIRRRKK